MSSDERTATPKREIDIKLHRARQYMMSARVNPAFPFQNTLAILEVWPAVQASEDEMFMAQFHKVFASIIPPAPPKEQL